MKYDQCEVIGTEARANDNISYGKISKKHKKVNLLDIFVVQAIVCAAISCVVLLTRFITMG